LLGNKHHRLVKGDKLYRLEIGVTDRRRDNKLSIFSHTLNFFFKLTWKYMKNPMNMTAHIGYTLRLFRVQLEPPNGGAFITINGCEYS
jgi:hypothetical protein